MNVVNGWGVFDNTSTNVYITSSSNASTISGTTITGYGSPPPDRDPLRWLRRRVDEVCALGRLDV